MVAEALLGLAAAEVIWLPDDQDVTSWLNPDTEMPILEGAVSAFAADQQLDL